MSGGGGRSNGLANDADMARARREHWRPQLVVSCPLATDRMPTPQGRWLLKATRAGRALDSTGPHAHVRRVGSVLRGPPLLALCGPADAAWRSAIVNARSTMIRVLCVVTCTG